MYVLRGGDRDGGGGKEEGEGARRRKEGKREKGAERRGEKQLKYFQSVVASFSNRDTFLYTLAIQGPEIYWLVGFPTQEWKDRMILALLRVFFFFRSLFWDILVNEILKVYLLGLCDGISGLFIFLELILGRKLPVLTRRILFLVFMAWALRFFFPFLFFLTRLGNPCTFAEVVIPHEERRIHIQRGLYVFSFSEIYFSLRNILIFVPRCIFFTGCLLF
jgi:hypothetical protein